jgi:hypothetical protein
MNLEYWISCYLLASLFWKWLYSWGGAEMIEGWKSFLVLGWFGPLLDAEMIRLYALIMWLLGTIWFVAGIFFPELR